MRVLFVFVACLALASCTSAPRMPTTVFAGEARGHSLNQTDILVVNVSNLWASAGRSAKSDGDQDSQRKVEPAGDTEALRKEFFSGFKEVKPDARISTAGEHIKAACFTAAGLAEREPWDEPIRPSLDSPACQAALQASHVRYLVSVHAWLAIDSKTESEASYLGIGTTKEIRYHFEAVAAVFDVATGSRICVDRNSQNAVGDLAAGIVLVPTPLPLPIPMIWGTRVDAQAYWKHVAWQAGARAATCFVAPT
jgi:hypothetical protein